MKAEQLEIDRLRREVAKLKAERDILKRPQPTLRGSRHEVRFHCEAPFHLAGGMAWEALGVSRSGFHAWLKRGPGARSREDEVVMPAVRASFVVSPHLWRPSDLRYVPEAGFSCGLHKIERLMRSQALRAATQARPAERRRRTLGLGDRAECARSPVHGGPAQPQMDCRLHPCLNSRGLALSRRGDRSVFAPRSRLVNEARDERATRHRRVVNGDLTARAPGCAVASLRQSIDQGRFLV